MKNNDLTRNYLNGGIKPLSDLFRIDENGILKPTKKVIVYDLETTGLDPNKSNITQFAYSVFDTDWNYLSEESIDEWIKLETVRFEDIAKKVVNLTHLKKENLENGKDLKDVLKKFLLDSKDAIVISFNGFNFDDKFISLQTIKKFEQDKEFWKEIETNLKDFKFNSDFDVFPFQYFMLKNKDLFNHKLETIANYFNLNPDSGQAHNAEYDSALTINILRKLLALGLDHSVSDYPTINLNADILSVNKRGIREGNDKQKNNAKFFINFTPVKPPHQLTYSQLESLAKVRDNEGFKKEVDEYNRLKDEGIERPEVENQLPFNWAIIKNKYCPNQNVRGLDEMYKNERFNYWRIKQTVITEIPMYYESLESLDKNLEALRKECDDKTFEEIVFNMITTVYSPKKVLPKLNQFLELIKYSQKKEEHHVIPKYFFNQSISMIELLKMTEYLEFEKNLILEKKKRLDKNQQTNITR